MQQPRQNIYLLSPDYSPTPDEYPLKRIQHVIQCDQTNVVSNTPSQCDAQDDRQTLQRVRKRKHPAHEKTRPDPAHYSGTQTMIAFPRVKKGVPPAKKKYFDQNTMAVDMMQLFALKQENVNSSLYAEPGQDSYPTPEYDVTKCERKDIVNDVNGVNDANEMKKWKYVPEKITLAEKSKEADPVGDVDDSRIEGDADITSKEVIDINAYSDADVFHTMMCERLHIRTRCDPDTLRRVITHINQELRRDRPKPLVLCGPPGCGKTQLTLSLQAYAESHDCTFLNLTDMIKDMLDDMMYCDNAKHRARVKTRLQGYISVNMKSMTKMSSKKRVVVVDEVDAYPAECVSCICSNALSAIHVVVLVCNDPYALSTMKTFRTHVEIIRMRAISLMVLNKYLQKVNVLCGSPLRKYDVHSIIDAVNGDFRCALQNYLFYARHASPIHSLNACAKNVSMSKNTVFQDLHALRKKDMDYCCNYIQRNEFITTLFQLNWEKYFEKSKTLFPVHYSFTDTTAVDHFVFMDMLYQQRFVGIESYFQTAYEQYSVLLTAQILHTYQLLPMPNCMLSTPKPTSHYIQQGKKNIRGIVDITLTQDAKYLISTGRSSLLTPHAAKGLDKKSLLQHLLFVCR